MTPAMWDMTESYPPCWPVWKVTWPQCSILGMPASFQFCNGLVQMLFDWSRCLLRRFYNSKINECWAVLVDIVLLEDLTAGNLQTTRPGWPLVFQFFQKFLHQRRLSQYSQHMLFPYLGRCDMQGINMQSSIWVRLVCICCNAACRFRKL